jgi:hypothetical protein
MTLTPRRPMPAPYAVACRLFALVAGLGAPGLAAAEETPYAVSKIAVDITAKDAVAAKDTAMADAERRAVDVVLRRLVPFVAYPQLPILSQDDVEGMVRNVSFLREQNSTTRYIATLDVSVNELAVKQLLASRNIPFSEARGPRIAILPLVFEGDAVKREGGGGWRQAWTDLDLSHGMVPADIVEPPPSLDAATLKAILAGKPGAYAAVKGSFGDAPLVIAVAVATGGTFATRLVGADGVGAINFGRADKVTGGDIKSTSRDAAATASGILETRWKVMQSRPLKVEQVRQEQGGVPGAPQGEPERNVVAVVEFAGLKQWQEIHSRLMQVTGIQALEVNSLSARTASITFDYAGSLGRLQKELDQNGFVFENREDNFVLRSR